ncbi:hypothetical protein [Pontibacter sp. G13]|uniref:hypothetical protein n=1 Tax=Pontibacter sp. G13 TaxID=3074898 RepID=UPI00288C5B06|nr:hypothetical protein [Pontibacter sp. G13]WNJ17999.1 hypothetical protein RJD25_24350 [Pontibacter sp. G13]
MLRILYGGKRETSLLIYLLLPSLLLGQSHDWTLGGLRAKRADLTVPQPVMVLSDQYPQLTAILEGQSSFLNQLPADSISLQVNEAPARVLSFREGMPKYPFLVGLVLDLSLESSEWQDVSNVGKTDPEPTSDNLRYQTDAAISFLQSLQYPKDSALVIGVSDGTAHTDLNDHVPGMQAVLETWQPLPGRSLYDGMQLGLESLMPHEGRKAVVVVTAGKDVGSGTPAQVVARSAQLQRIPVYVIWVGDAPDVAMERIARNSGGALITTESFRMLGPTILGLSEFLQSVFELRYEVNEQIESAPVRHNLHVTFQRGEKALEMDVAYQIPEDVVSAIVKSKQTSERPSIWAILGSLLAVGLGVALFLWLRSRVPGGASSGVVVPAIMEAKLDGRKHLLQVRVNIPNRDLAARLTLETQQGTPVKAFVLKGEAKKADLDISDLPAGIYHGKLHNDGLVSEVREIVWNPDHKTE